MPPIEKTLLLELLLESLNERNFEATQRTLTWGLYPRKATIITGVRRCGKSTFLMQMANEWKENANGREWFYLNFVDDRLLGFTAQHLSLILEAFEEIKLQKKMKLTEVLFIFDEIQEVEGWEPFVERCLRKKNLYVAISGSSSKMLSSEMATQMRGRSLPLELFPMSPVEAAKHLQISSAVDTLKQRTEWKEFCRQFLIWGGFPEVLSSKNMQHKRLILQQYLETMILRDIIERHKITQTIAVHRLQNLIFGNFSALLTQNKMLEKLKAQGIGLDRNLIPVVLEAFTDCFSCFFVPLYTDGMHKQQVNPKKIYLVDTAWATLIGQSFENNRGRFLENAVFIHLRRKGAKIFYGKTKNEREIDFVVQKPGETKLKIFQIAWSLNNLSTRQRELKALQEFMHSYKINKACLITEDEEEEIVLDQELFISVIPFWKWVRNED